MDSNLSKIGATLLKATQLVAEALLLISKLSPNNCLKIIHSQCEAPTDRMGY